MSNMLRATPHTTIPGLLTPQTQNADWRKYLAGKTAYGSFGDEYLYITTASAIASDTFVGQQWGKNLPKQNYALGQMQSAYYNIESYVEWNTQEQEKFEKLAKGVALPKFLEDLAIQGINQKLHQAILYGFDAYNSNELGQGILSNSTMKTMPKDSSGNQTLTSYDKGELLQFLVSCAREVMDATFNLTKPVVIASSVRVVNYLKSVLVPLTQYADTGSVDSVGGVYDRVAGGMLGVGNITWIADNLLLGDTTDTLLFLAPGIEPNDDMGQDSSNLVGQETSIKWNTFIDMIGGGVHRFENTPNAGWYGFKMVTKTTSGINLRKEACLQVPLTYI